MINLLIWASRFSIFLSFSSYFSTKMLCSRYTLRYSFLMRASCMFFTLVIIRELAGSDSPCWKILIALWTLVDFDKLSEINCSICCRMSANKLKLIWSLISWMLQRNTFVLVVELLFVNQTLHNFNVAPYQFYFISDRWELKAKADS